MKNPRQILVTELSIATLLLTTKAYCDKYLEESVVIQKNDYTDLGLQSIDKHVWKCYIPSSKMGKSNRGINSEEGSFLLQYVKHIDDIHLITHYKKLSHESLENTFITIVFLNYDNDEITERIQKALFIKNITKKGSRNGSVDVLKQEKEFQRSLKKGEKITDYINRSGKHPLASFLNINPRTLYSYNGGEK